ncbi:hypothetical protein BDZ85DRAFT_312529 [Elsinoe ampelina]|uniref:Uncharacterized protein n=1 Tax=Elsinoe ampelina TaxID=302913 RepID=A0A6A6GB73_9PEZI|nr:hypothetical protein BDZ85DRAFT_312529 [Elsinoe ampelina]
MCQTLFFHTLCEHLYSLPRPCGNIEECKRNLQLQLLLVGLCDRCHHDPEHSKMKEKVFITKRGILMIDDPNISNEELVDSLHQGDNSAASRWAAEANVLEQLFKLISRIRPVVNFETNRVQELVEDVEQRRKSLMWDFLTGSSQIVHRINRLDAANKDFPTPAADRMLSDGWSALRDFRNLCLLGMFTMVAQPVVAKIRARPRASGELFIDPWTASLGRGYSSDMIRATTVIDPPFSAMNISPDMTPAICDGYDDDSLEEEVEGLVIFTPTSSGSVDDLRI